MSENRDPERRPAAYDFDAEPEWDVEKELFGKKEPEPPKLETPYPDHTRRLPEQPVGAQMHRAPRKRKRRRNVRGWLVLAATAMVVLLVVGGLVSLAVAVITPETESLPSTEPTEPTLPPEEVAAELLEKAEPLAMSYDYDAAIAVLEQFGTDWQQQPKLADAYRRYTDAKSTCVRYEDTTQTTHIFFHSLIVDTARAFDGDNETNGYNQYMTTVDEFKAMLEELYKRNFVLVRIHDIAVEQTDANGATSYVQGDIYLPPEKKPLIISQDDVNYYEYMVDSDGDKLPDAGGDGFANRLVIGDDGKPTCQYITAEGETVYGDYDLVPILDKFVEEHPDFSYRGAKAIIAVTGYEGVYGYHTHPEWKEIIGIDEYDKECQAAREMTKCLKENGYEIASHSFGHPSYGEHSVDEVAEDVQKWEEQVQPIVGDTDIFIYPYGADIAGVEDYSGGKYEAMYAAGYRYFCNVDSTKYWVQIKQNYVRQGRRNLDGYRMWWNPELLEDLFDVQEIFDPARPTPVPSIV